MKRIIINRLLYIIIGAVIGSSLVYLGCGESDKPFIISAKNIVFRNAKNNAVSQNKFMGSKSASSGGLVPSAYAQEELQDDSLKVFAEDVLVDTNDNSLESENLQDALDNEMAIDIPSALSGKTWHIENRSDSKDLANSQGQITFTSSSQFTMDNGVLAVLGTWAQSADRKVGGGGPNYPYTEFVNVEFLSNNTLWVEWQAIADYFDGGIGTFGGVIQIIPVKKDKFIFTGYSFATGYISVSTLTLVE